MADKKISAMAALLASEATLSDYVPVVDESLVAGSPANANKRMTFEEWILFLTGGTGRLIIGDVAPTTEGFDGDTYLHRTVGDVYGPKTAGSWGSPVLNLVGESWFSRKQTVAISSGVVTIDYADGRLVDIPLTEDITSFVFTNWPTTGTAGSITMRFTIGGTPPHTIAFASIATTMKAEGGTYPAVPTDADSVLVVTLYSADALTVGELYIGASDMKEVV